MSKLFFKMLLCIIVDMCRLAVSFEIGNLLSTFKAYNFFSYRTELAKSIQFGKYHRL